MAACAGGERRLFLLTGIANLEEAVELIILLVDAVSDPRLVLLTRGGRGLLDELNPMAKMKKTYPGQHPIIRSTKPVR